MTASKDTLVQVNFKTRNGTLINVYGNDEPSFDLGLAIIQDRIATFTEIEQQLSGAGVVGEQVALASVQPPAAAGVPDVAPAAPPAASWGQPPAPAPAAAFTAGAVRQCAHGVMTARSGQSARGRGRRTCARHPRVHRVNVKHSSLTTRVPNGTRSLRN